MKNKVFFFSFLAMVCSAIGNVVTERKLAQHHPIALTFWFCFIMTVMIFPVVMKKNLLTVGSGNDGYSWLFFFWTGLLSLVYLVADYCFFKAYNEGGAVAQISTIMTLTPVAGMLINMATGGKMPTINQVIGYILAAIGIYLITKK